MSDWSNEEIEYLRKFFPTEGGRFCIAFLNKTLEAINIKAKRMGLEKDKQCIEKIKKETSSSIRKALLKNTVGEEGMNNQGCRMKVAEYFGKENVTVEFIDYPSIRKNITMHHFRTGEVKNRYFPEVMGIGYLGEGLYKANSNGKKTQTYNTWKSMLNRCYSKNKGRKFYEDVVVCDEWHNFQNFAEWYEHNWKPFMDNTWHLDKDLWREDIKVYSPKTCCFLPREINTIITKRISKKSNLKTGVKKSGRKFSISFSKGQEIFYKDGYDTEEKAYEEYSRLKKEYLLYLLDNYRNYLNSKDIIKLERFRFS